MGADLIIVPFSELTSSVRDIPFEQLGLVSQALKDYRSEQLKSISESFPSHDHLPNSADLHFAKNVVRVARERDLYSGQQTQGLNQLAQSIGFKTFASLLKQVPSVLQSPTERENSLLPIALWVLQALGLENEDDFYYLIQEIVPAAAAIPVFQYTYRTIDGHLPREHRIYSAGFLVDIGPQSAMAHSLNELGLPAVNYKVRKPKLLHGFDEDAFMAMAPAQREEHYQCAYMRDPSESIHKSLEDQHIVIQNNLGKGSEYWLDSSHLQALYGVPSMMLSFPDYGCSDALQTCPHVVSKGKMVHFFVSDPFTQGPARQGPVSVDSLLGSGLVGERLKLEELMEVTGLSQTVVHRLSGSPNTLSQYVLQLPKELTEERFILNANLTGAYGVEDEFLYTARALQSIARHEHAHPFLSDIVQALIFTLTDYSKKAEHGEAL